MLNLTLSRGAGRKKKTRTRTGIDSFQWQYDDMLTEWLDAILSACGMALGFPKNHSKPCQGLF